MLKNFIAWCRSKARKGPAKEKPQEKPKVDASKEDLFVEIDISETCMIGFGDEVKLVLFKNVPPEHAEEAYLLSRHTHLNAEIVLHIEGKYFLFPAQKYQSFAASFCEEISEQKLNRYKYRALNPDVLSLSESLASANEETRKLYFPT